ncbi:hypothetical protein ACWIUD_06805 [Helicobacter sp. 23-1044]
MFGNLFWGNHLRCFGTKFRSMDAQVLFRSFRAKTTQSTTAITSIVIRNANQSAKNLSLRGSLSEAKTTKQSKQNLVAQSAPKTRPLRGAKNRFQTSSSASADFLLEAEKRGTPPKSEKAAAFWEHNLNEVGGSGSGVQPFLRKDSSESNAKNGATIADSANQIKNAESQILPLPCGGGQRGWVKFNLSSLRDLPLANRGNPQKKYLVSTIHTKIAESTPKSQNPHAESNKKTQIHAEVSLSDFVGFGAIGRENRTLSPLSAQERTIPQKHQRDNAKRIYMQG